MADLLQRNTLWTVAFFILFSLRGTFAVQHSDSVGDGHSPVTSMNTQITEEPFGPSSRKDSELIENDDSSSEVNSSSVTAASNPEQRVIHSSTESIASGNKVNHSDEFNKHISSSTVDSISSIYSSESTANFSISMNNGDYSSNASILHWLTDVPQSELTSSNILPTNSTDRSPTSESVSANVPIGQKGVWPTPQPSDLPNGDSRGRGDSTVSPIPPTAEVPGDFSGRQKAKGEGDGEQVVHEGITFERILLRNYSEFVAVKGRYTVRRRTVPSPQLECIAGCTDALIPEEIRCVQRSPHSKRGVYWHCTSRLPRAVTLNIVSINCEGFDKPHDEFVTKDSCYVKFSLQSRSRFIHVKDELLDKRLHQHSSVEGSSNSRSFDLTDDNFAIFPYLIPAVVLVGGIIVVLMVFTCCCPRDKEETPVPPMQPAPMPTYHQPEGVINQAMSLQQQSFQNPYSNPHPFASPAYGPGYNAPPTAPTPNNAQPAQYPPNGQYPPGGYPPTQYPTGAYPPTQYPPVNPYAATGQMPPAAVQQVQPARSGGGAAAGLGSFVAGAAMGGLGGYALNSMLHHGEGEHHETTTTVEVEPQRDIDVIEEQQNNMYGGAVEETLADAYQPPVYSTDDQMTTTTTDYYEPPAFDSGGDFGDD